MRIKSFLLIFLFLNILFVFSFKNDTKIIEHIKSLIKKPLNSFSKYKAPNKMLCQLCQSTIKPINLLLKNRYAVNITKDIVILVCSIFLEFEECSTLITEFYPLMVDSLIDRILNPRYICSKLAICSNYHYKTLNPDDYARKLLNETKIYKKQTSKESKEIKILQIADLHIDLEYQEGSSGNCGHTCCCRKFSGMPKSNSDRAGKFGFVGPCDLPKITVEQSFDYIANVVKPDLIVWTGDSPSHFFYNMTQYEPIEAINFTCSVIRDKLKNIPVFPSLGNHENFPIDLFNPFNFSKNEFLLNKTSSLYGDWLNDKSKQTYLKYGYYSQKVIGTDIKVISLNTMLNEDLNFHLLRDNTNAFKWVDFLENELRNSEQNGESVIIIGHVPPADNYFISHHSYRYNALIDRFSHIIKGQFFGHTHSDEVKIVHGYFNKSLITGVVHIAPSFTTYSSRFPSFRVFNYDTNNNLLLDFSQYRLNLTETNLNPESKFDWKVAYNASKIFNVSNLNQYEKINNYIEKIKTNNEIYLTVLSNYYGGEPNLMQKVLKKDLMESLYCKFSSDIFRNYLKCSKYKPMDMKDNVLGILDLISNEWYEEIIHSDLDI